MTAPVDQYTPVEHDLIGDADMLETLLQLAAGGALRIRSNAWRVDINGNDLEDLGPWWMPVGGSIKHDATADLPGRLTTRLARELTWGGQDALVRARVLLASDDVDGGRYKGFDQGVYVCTSPQTADMDRAGVTDITGYDLTYLLDTEPADSMSWGTGTLYRTMIRDCFRAAGLLPGTLALSDVADCPNDWNAKTLPGPVSYALGSGATLLQMVNEQLQASGQRPLYTNRRGRWQISALDGSNASAWTWASGPVDGYTPAHWPASKIVLFGRASYSGDVYGIPNRLQYVQSGLTFDPTPGSGMYVYDNLTIPPADQTTLKGQIRVRTRSLQASGQDDLETQAKADIQATLSAAEKVSLTTIPWPMSWHYDQFQHVSPAYPGAPVRMLEERSWTLPLHGTGGMTHDAYAVVNL